MPDYAWPLDILTRGIKYVAEGPTQAAISISEGGAPTLYLVETRAPLGPGVNAATGLGSTVITDGSVAYGNGCFMAARGDSQQIMRGKLNKGRLAWTNVYRATGDIVRFISFAGGAFFVVSRTVTSDGAKLYVARSTSGKDWTSTQFLNGADDGGSVAALKIKEDRKIFCSVGSGAGSSPDYSVLYSATSTNGVSWGTSVSSKAYSGLLGVGAGNGVFVTGGFAYGTEDVSVPVVDGSTIILTFGTAQAQFNRSPNGASWSTGNLPVPGGHIEPSSFGGAAVFVTDKKGHFVITAEGTAGAYALKSTNGVAWAQQQQWPDGSCNSLCIVGKTIGRIVIF